MTCDCDSCTVTVVTVLSVIILGPFFRLFGPAPRTGMESMDNMVEERGGLTTEQERYAAKWNRFFLIFVRH